MRICVTCCGELVCHPHYKRPGWEAVEGLIIESVTNKGPEEGTFYICLPCNAYYLVCPSCGQFCVLEGHPGYELPPHPDDDHVPHFVRHQPGRSKYGNEFMPYSLGNVYMNYLDVNRWQPTGPNGGMKHYWRCDNCRSSFVHSHT